MSKQNSLEQYVKAHPEGPIRVLQGKAFAPGIIDPAGAADVRGRGGIGRWQGGAEVADRLVWLRKNDNDAYEWQDIISLGGDPRGVLPIFVATKYGVRSEEDGGTNMSVKMQDFLAVVRDAGGGVAYFPAGTYRGGSLVVYANTHVLGDGIGRTIFKRRDSTANQIFMLDDRATDITLSHFTVDGNRDNAAKGNGIETYGNRRLHVHHVEVREMTGYGIGVGFDDFQTPIRDCLFENIWLHDIGDTVTVGNEWQGDGFDAKRCRNSTWRNIRIEHIANTGLDVRGSMCVVENVQAVRCGEYVRTTDEVGGKGIGLTQVPGGADALFDDMDPNPGAPFGYNILRDSFAFACGGNGFNITQENFDTDDPSWASEEIINRAQLSNLVAVGNSRCGFEWHSTYDCDAITEAINLLAECNGSHGFNINADQQVLSRYSFVNCHARDNGGHGFYDQGGTSAAGAECADCTARGNTLDGFRATAPYTRYSGCNAEANGDDGFVVETTASDAQLVGCRALALPASSIGISTSGDRALITNFLAVGGSATGLSIAATADETRYDNINTNGCGTSVSNSGTNTSAGTVI